MTVLPFSEKEYGKLNMAVFPTVRRRDKYGDVGDEVTVEHGPPRDRTELGQAKIIAKEERSLESLPTSFLLFDTEQAGKSTERFSAWESLNSFYRNDIQEDEVLTLYWLQWETVETSRWTPEEAEDS